MRTVPFIVGLVIALVLSGQILLLTERRRPLAKRLRDLTLDSFALLFAAMLTLGMTGAVLGSLFGSPGTGGAAGLVLALLIWTIAVIWAHRQPQPPARHQAPD